MFLHIRIDALLGIAKDLIEKEIPTPLIFNRVFYELLGSSIKINLRTRMDQMFRLLLIEV